MVIDKTFTLTLLIFLTSLVGCQSGYNKGVEQVRLDDSLIQVRSFYEEEDLMFQFQLTVDDSLRTGESYFKDTTGIETISNYINDTLYGDWIIKKEGDTIQKGSYYSGLKNGEWIDYKDGKATGLGIYKMDGLFYSRTNYTDTSYTPNGNPYIFNLVSDSILNIRDSLVFNLFCLIPSDTDYEVFFGEGDGNGVPKVENNRFYNYYEVYLNNDVHYTMNMYTNSFFFKEVGQQELLVAFFLRDRKTGQNEKYFIRKKVLVKD